jgi:methionyl aminopeptidase
MKREYVISIKTQDEIDLLRDAGKTLAGIVERLKSSLTNGITTREIDRIAEDLIRESGAKPAFKGYRGFPGCVCLSVNEEVVHGIPKDRIILDGDIVSLDVGIIYRDYYSDTAVTVGIGQLSDALNTLLKVTEESLYKRHRAGSSVQSFDRYFACHSKTC